VEGAVAGSLVSLIELELELELELETAAVVALRLVVARVADLVEQLFRWLVIAVPFL
jgi:hypothetical protein